MLVDKQILDDVEKIVEWDGLKKNKLPQFLSHYSSIDNLKLILKSGEFWLSNPLFMNDYQEMAHGMRMARAIVNENLQLKEAFEKPEDYERFIGNFANQYDHFDYESALSVFVLSLAEHDSSDEDGLLSMWRGYGALGNGAALIINTSHIVQAPTVIGKVNYLSDEDRKAGISAIVDQFASLIRRSAHTEANLGHCCLMLFYHLRLMSLLTKHPGFKEEREWRFIYLKDHDDTDALADSSEYVVTTRGVQPKLKLRLETLGAANATLNSANGLIERIILGPSHQSRLALKTFQGMLNHMNLEALSPKVNYSTIPFRN